MRIGTMRKLQLSAAAFLFPFLLAQTARGETSSPVSIVSQISVPFSTQTQCQFSIAPTKAVIIGGIKVKALKPLTAKERLQGQVQEIKSYVEKQGGELVLGEVLRAVAEVRDNPEPYTTAQKFEIFLPLTADVDSILEDILKFGMNMFGKNQQLDGSGSSPQVLVFYRIENLNAAVFDGVRRCAVSALRSWCESNNKAADLCGMNERELAPKIGIQYYYLQSENRIYDSNYPQALTFSKDTPYPKNGDLAGSTALEVRGTVTIQFEQTMAQNPAPASANPIDRRNRE